MGVHETLHWRMLPNLVEEIQFVFRQNSSALALPDDFLASVRVSS
jgi:hypothetical protein